MEKDTTIELEGVKIRPIRDEKGHVLKDDELVNFANELIDEYEKTYKEASPIDAKFKQWLKEAKEFIDKGGNIFEYKKSTVSKLIPYEMYKNVK